MVNSPSPNCSNPLKLSFGPPGWLCGALLPPAAQELRRGRLSCCEWSASDLGLYDYSYMYIYILYVYYQVIKVPF